MTKIHSKIKIPVALSYVGGLLHDLVYKTIIRGEERSYNNETLTLNGLNPGEQVSFSDLQTIIQNGGSFEGIKLGLEFSATGSNRLVPEEVPGSFFVNELEVLVNRTWIEWIQAQPLITVKKKVGENLYIIKAAWQGVLLDSEALVAAHTQTGVTVLEWDEMKLRHEDEINWETYEI